MCTETAGQCRFASLLRVPGVFDQAGAASPQSRRSNPPNSLGARISEVNRAYFSKGFGLQRPG